MYNFPFVCLLIALVAGVFASGYAAYLAWSGRNGDGVLKTAQIGVGALIVISSIILINALATQDFSYSYVADFTDSLLPKFYAITAFWAGQEGSMLFWALVVALFGVVFMFTPTYKDLKPRSRPWFWMFYLAVEAFFLFILTSWSNPFMQIQPAPPDGGGLNPLLQHPGMIFHPPLLFLGYGGFTIPMCLALSEWLAGDGPGFVRKAHNWALISWIFLTAGIILGAWWSYMELGWGGYWAWDPVENASLIPWLMGTAYMHTAVMWRNRNSLPRTNLWLISLTFVLCFFGTYLVRSGVIDSLHAFGDGGVGGPLLVFILAVVGMTLLVHLAGPRPQGNPLSGIVSRDGFLVVAWWLFAALSIVVLLGTMWPVISKTWSPNPQGLDAGFYNRVCLPLFAAIAALMAACLWFGWRGGLKRPRLFFAAVAFFLASVVVFFLLGYQNILALIGSGAALTLMLGVVLLFAADRTLRRRRTAWGAYLVHVGIALMVFGVAFSGPYKIEKEARLAIGDTVAVEDYEFTYKEFDEDISEAMAVFEARIEVSKNGCTLGLMKPQRRMYRNFDQPFAEASVISGLGDELYASLLGFDRERRVSVKFSIHPLINWIWIGGVISCVFAFLGLRSRRAAGRSPK